MTLELLIAATERHGPPHSVILGVLAVAVWLIYRAVTRRTGSTHDAHADAGPARTPGATDAPDSDRGRGL